MARSIVVKTNTLAPSVTYPYGDILDDPGNNTGTPVDRAVYADFHQFFAKMFDASGLVYNNLPDNATNGFQFFDALQNNIYKHKSIVFTVGNTQLNYTMWGSLIFIIAAGTLTMPPANNIVSNGRSMIILNPFAGSASTVIPFPGDTFNGNNVQVLEGTESIKITQVFVGNQMFIENKYNIAKPKYQQINLSKTTTTGAWETVPGANFTTPNYGIRNYKIRISGTASWTEVISALNGASLGIWVAGGLANYVMAKRDAQASGNIYMPFSCEFDAVGVSPSTLFEMEVLRAGSGNPTITQITWSVEEF